MLIKDYESEVEWWTDRSSTGTRIKFYARMETDGDWQWYEFDDYTSNLIELDADKASELEAMRDGS